jgi:hypothetical protein
MMPQVRSGWHLSFLTGAARPEVRVLQLPFQDRKKQCLIFREDRGHWEGTPQL